MKNEESQMAERKKILVLGHQYNSKEVKSYNWNRLPIDLNLADFEVVIMDLTQFDDDNFIKSLPKRNLFDNCNFNNFLFSPDNELIIIGYPYHYEKEIEGREAIFWFENLFPFYPRFTNAIGNALREIDKDYEFLFKNIEKWSKHLESNTLSLHYEVGRIPNYITENYQGITQPVVFIEITPIAITLTKHPIAFSFSSKYNFTQKVAGGMRISWVPTAKITSLPPTTNLSIGDAIIKILTVRFGVSLELAFPEWVGNYKTSSQKQVESNILRFENNKKQIEGLLQVQYDSLLIEAKYQKLLFEQGDSLQSIVHDAFELLGAEVDRKDEKTDDGKIIYKKNNKGILEVKGKKNCIERKDIRQLEDWKDNAEKVEGFERKGIFVANCFIDKELNERGEYFPDKTANKAEDEGFCLLKTSQIFKAICLLKENKLDKKKFWETIFGTNGVAVIEDI